MQLNLPDAEINRLANRIEQDYKLAIGDHERRMERFRRYYQKWRNRVDPPNAGDEDASNFSVPLTQWHVYAKWAQSAQALFGDDAEIIARPVGPSDQRTVAKVARYMNWRVFDSMNLVNPFLEFQFRKILFGRAHAYRPWVIDEYETDRGIETWYEGPGFYPLAPDDLIVPAEDARTIHDFSFVIRKYWTTPDEMLRRDGTLYQGVKERFQQIVNFAQDRRRREWIGDETKRETDEAEGVSREMPMSAGESILVHEWYGRWRRLAGQDDGDEHDIAKRQMLRSELVVRYLPDLRIVVGVQDLKDLYPRQRFKRPFVESSMVKDGTYWCPGLGELLESIEDEATANHRLFTDAGRFSVGPVILAKPGSGFNADTFEYEPRTIHYCEDPQAVNVIKVQTDMSFSLAKDQALMSIAERVDGVSDQTLGRAIERPNAPRTASGQIALIEQGNIRVGLETLSMREDMRAILRDIWELDSQFSPESVFFRVTEEDADGLFDVRGGGAEMTAAERGGRYDFDIRFATSVWSREANKEREIQRYGLDLQNPLIVQNQRALWMVTNRVHKALGDDNFADLVPEPPDLDMPKPPREEWTLMLQGQDVEVNPNDNDDLHLLDHYRRLDEAKRGRGYDEFAGNKMVAHILQHQGQKRQKMLMQAMTQSLVQSLQQNTPQTGGLQLGGGVPTGLMDVQQTIAGLTGGGAQPSQQLPTPPKRPQPPSGVVDTGGHL
jgi:hypothetical protein